MNRKDSAVAANTPRIVKMTFAHAERTGYTVHAELDKVGPMDITMTVAQYHGVCAQLADHGYATIPTGDAAAA